MNGAQKLSASKSISQKELCRYTVMLTLGRTRGRGWDHAPIRFFQIFEKTIYSKGLKLSVAVHSSSAIFDVAMATTNFM